MTFPVRIGFGAWRLPPRPVFELLAWKRRRPVLRGVLLGALITTLVNGAACFGVMR
jgi:hypothetical protein